MDSRRVGGETKRPAEGVRGPRRLQRYSGLAAAGGTERVSLARFAGPAGLFNLFGPRLDGLVALDPGLVVLVLLAGMHQQLARGRQEHQLRRRLVGNIVV